MFQTNTLEVQCSPYLNAKEEIRTFKYSGSMLEVAI